MLKERQDRPVMIGLGLANSRCQLREGERLAFGRRLQSQPQEPCREADRIDIGMAEFYWAQRVGRKRCLNATQQSLELRLAQKLLFAHDGNQGCQNGVDSGKLEIGRVHESTFTTKQPLFNVERAKSIPTTENIGAAAKSVHLDTLRRELELLYS